MRAKRVSMIVAVPLVLACAGYLACKKIGQSDVSALRTVEASEGAIEETVEATGVVSPLNRVEIKPPIAGRIDKLFVQEGQAVKAGQIVATMSSTDRAAILDAALAQGPAEFKRWQDSYKPTPIVAPLSGGVILCDVVEGQTVGTSQVIYAISDSLIVLGQVDESDIGRVKLGMPARITLDSYPDQPVQGKVFEILYEGKNVSNVITYGVKIRPDRVPSFFRSQMTANLSLILARKEKAVLLPSTAVRESDGGKAVLVPGPDGKPVSRKVETGLETGDNVEIVSGLEAGEKVVLAGRRYVPQKAPQDSPLNFSGPKRPTQKASQSGSKSKKRA